MGIAIQSILGMSAEPERVFSGYLSMVPTYANLDAI